MLTNEEIQEINRNSPDDQGVFVSPDGVPIQIKEPCVYMRWVTGGASGGSYLDEGDDPGAQYFSGDPEPYWKALELVVEKLAPGIPHKKYLELESLSEENNDSNYEYYGNYTDYSYKYIPLSKIGEFLNQFI